MSMELVCGIYALVVKAKMPRHAKKDFYRLRIPIGKFGAGAKSPRWLIAPIAFPKLAATFDFALSAAAKSSVSVGL